MAAPSLNLDEATNSKMKNLICGMMAAYALLGVTGMAAAQGCRPAPSGSHEFNKSESLTLERAVIRAGNASPEVRQAALESRAAMADADQAGRPINPAITLEADSFAGSGALDGFNAIETTLSIEQTFRLGRKRFLSESAARAKAALASAECEVQKLEAQRLAGELFIELEASIALNEVASASADLAEEFASLVARRVDAGAAAPPELSRAKAEAAILQAAADLARGEIEARALELASVWGSPAVDFLLPNQEQWMLSADRLDSEPSGTMHPQIRAARAAIDARAAETERERASAWPDLTVYAGVRRFEDTGDQAFLAGVSLPLPLFDLNQDAVRASKLRSQKAEISSRATEARLLAEQSRLVSQVRAAQSRLERLESEALPLSESAYASAAEGYRVGKFNLTATLEARRSLIETRAAVIDARMALHTQTLRLRALIGAAPFQGDVQ